MTPAILLVCTAGVPHEVLGYAQDASTLSSGREAVEALGHGAASVFRTSGEEVEGVELQCALVPVSGMPDLAAAPTAAAVTAWRAKMAEAAVLGSPGLQQCTVRHLPRRNCGRQTGAR